MVTGIISTARGESLNIDELIMRGRRPVGRAAKSTRENPNYSIAVNNQPKVRGFVPTSIDLSPTELEAAELTTIVKTDAIASAYAETGEAKTMSDLTGIRVSKSSDRTARPASDDPSVVTDSTDQALGNLLGKLQQTK